MSKWKDVLEEKNSDTFKEKVKNAVAPHIEENAKIAAEKSDARFSWLRFLVPASVSLGVVVFLLAKNLKEKPRGGALVSNEEELRFRSHVAEIAQNYDVLKDYQVIQNMDLLLKLEDPKKWPKEKS